MPHRLDRPDTARALAGLKDFQRDTVDYVFQRMYEDSPPARRFLIADEVGLGKTLVAKGIVARAIDHLRGRDPNLRIDIVYICSNLGIARQNIARLSFTGQTARSLPDRITLLPRSVRELEKQRLNFIAFTPGTSFDLRSSHGLAEERALLFWLLPDEWKVSEKGAVSVLTGPAARDRFRGRVTGLDGETLDEGLRRRFHDELDAVVGDARHRDEPDLLTRFTNLAEQLGGRSPASDEERMESAAIVGALRNTLATACLHALEPDLVILDEFQRFRDLLRGTDSASELARRLFTWQDVRVVLLSATPYKMYTTADEAEGEDHFKDFIQTVHFLHGEDAARTEAFREDLTAFRRELFRYGTDDGAALRRARDAVKEKLRRIMVRTERLAVTPNRDGMLCEVSAGTADLEPIDLEGYLAVQRVARIARQGDTVEYWKSAPYLLNFMDDYELKREFTALSQGQQSSELFGALENGGGALLSQRDLESYRRIDPANARMRALVRDTLEPGAWRMLWLPPAMPYYVLEGAYGGDAAASLTKRLVFSSWQVVPKVVSAILSYEAERRMFGIDEAGRDKANTPEARKRRARPLQFTLDDGRPARMAVLALVYPSVTLAVELDPWRIAAEVAERNGTGAREPSLREVAEEMKRRLEPMLATLDESGAENTGRLEPADQSWYWAAPILLDAARRPADAQAFWGQAQLAESWREPRSGEGAGEEALAAEDMPDAAEPAGAWSKHVDEARRLLTLERYRLGRQPDDLAEVVALLALAAPAVVALRAICRVAGGLQVAADAVVRLQAGRVGHGFLSLLNLPEVVAAIRQGRSEEEPYWRSALAYGAESCLQAVMDEFAHVLVDWKGVSGKSTALIVHTLGDAMLDALTVRAAGVKADIVTLDRDARRVVLDEKARHTFRMRFAVRYGGAGTEERRAVERQAELQKAFNSPFWPFVLCTTSVGQEGLDFHLYCHAVVHWNLPSNPVDLEQREGRVHRFKGHAVRKNVARAYRAAAFAGDAGPDPWSAVFRAARHAREDRSSDLVPYWVCTVQDGARIERHVPMLPMSRDSERAALLRQSLTVYRMAFGQNRQEDLVAYLTRHVPADQVEKAAAEVSIDLSPDPSERRRESGEDLNPVVGPVGPRPSAMIVEVGERVAGMGKAARQAVTYGGLRSLLDAFASTKATAVTDRLVGTAGASTRGLTGAQLADLLNAYSAIVPEQKARTRGVNDVENERLARLTDLLDRLAVLRPRVDPAATVQRYRLLLDRLRAIWSRGN